jgi:hypothetical protein
MEEVDEKGKQEAQMLNAIHSLAEKYGCRVQVDFEKHTIDFDCPNKTVELDLAMEIQRLMGTEE